MISYKAIKIFEYVKDLLFESTSQKVLALAVNSVIFMDQRSNIAMLIVRAKLWEFYQIQLE